MQDSYRFILEPYRGINTRHPCPNCNNGRTFSRYIDTETGKQIASKVGRCDREGNCGYHYTPKQYFRDNDITIELSERVNHTKLKISTIEQPEIISSISLEVFKRSLNHPESNNLVKFLFTLFGPEITTQLITRYFIATSNHWTGATIFWQIDIDSRIRTGKIMLYNPDSGKRVKDPYNHITWVHKVLNKENFNLYQCCFGEHLLKQFPNNTVGLVESEKTAIIASAYLPQMIWLAVGSLNNLSVDRCQSLKGRNIILFPDLNCFDKWSNKTQVLSHIAQFTISDLLERYATEEERKHGLDLADYLLRFDYREFNVQKPVQVLKSEKSEISVTPKTNIFLPQGSLCPADVLNSNKRLTLSPWDISEMEQFFETTPLPKFPINLKPAESIIDISKCVESLLNTVKAHNGKKGYLPYMEKLRDIRDYMTNNLN